MTDQARPSLTAEVRAAYLPPERWTCRVCGEPMVFASSGPEGTKYVCSVAAAGMSKPYDGTVMEHWSRSERWFNAGTDDRRVVALCDAAERLAEAASQLAKAVVCYVRHDHSTVIEQRVCAPDLRDALADYQRVREGL